MKTVNVVSSNPSKVEELQLIAGEYGIRLNWICHTKLEMQSYDPSEIVKFGASHAYSELNVPLVCEDTGLFISALKGFPGAYVAQSLHTIGIDGILKLLEGKRNRHAYYKTAIGYAAASGTRVFAGIAKGTISVDVHGGRIFGHDSIFIPEGYSRTFSELGVQEKNAVSHRAKAFRKFAAYFVRTTG